MHDRVTSNEDFQFQAEINHQFVLRAFRNGLQLTEVETILGSSPKLALSKVRFFLSVPVWLFCEIFM